MLGWPYPDLLAGILCLRPGWVATSAIVTHALTRAWWVHVRACMCECGRSHGRRRVVRADDQVVWREIGTSHE
eukprot:359676-Chlamydomonas_euryale.AAC.3